MATQRGKIDASTIKPGAQNPSKYPKVGPNYQKYGEVPGFVYDPWSDQYYKDKKAYEQYLIDTGQAEKPKGAPSLSETVAPIAVAGGALAAGQALGKNPSEFFGGIKEGLSGLLDFGGEEAASSVASDVASTSAVSEVPSIIGAGGEIPAFTLDPGAVASASEGVAAGTTAAETAAPTGLLDFSGIGSAGNAILPAVGLGLGADVLINKKSGGEGALEGAASGGLIGSYFGPVGTVVGTGVGGLAGYFGNFGDEDKFKTEEKRLQKLKDKGVNIPTGLIESMPDEGRSKSELVEIERARPDGNVEFAQSRDEKFLRPQDIIGFAAFAELDPDWFNKPIEQRLAKAKEYLDAGAVREHEGTISLDSSKVASAAAPTAQNPKVEDKNKPTFFLKGK